MQLCLRPAQLSRRPLPSGYIQPPSSRGNPSPSRVSDRGPPPQEHGTNPRPAGAQPPAGGPSQLIWKNSEPGAVRLRACRRTTLQRVNLSPLAPLGDRVVNETKIERILNLSFFFFLGHISWHLSVSETSVTLKTHLCERHRSQRSLGCHPQNSSGVTAGKGTDTACIRVPSSRVVSGVLDHSP